MTNNVSIRHLRAFIEVAACGSFTRAADTLHLTQSTLTATIKQLEEQAGLRLFDRTTRRVVLTKEGSDFLPVAEKLISDFDTAFTDLQATSSQQQGQVGIAASPSMIGQMLPPTITQYHELYPNIGICLRDDNAGGIEQRVLDNEVDFGIGGNHSNQSDLNYQPILKDRYGVVLPKGHSLSSSHKLTWATINTLPQVHLTEDTGTRSQLLVLSHQYQLGLKVQEPLLEVSTPAGLAELVKSGLGISILPSLAASTNAFDALIFVPLIEPSLYRQVCFITRRGRALSPAAESLLRLIRSSFVDAQLPDFVEQY